MSRTTYTAHVRTNLDAEAREPPHHSQRRSITHTRTTQIHSAPARTHRPTAATTSATSRHCRRCRRRSFTHLYLREVCVCVWASGGNRTLGPRALHQQQRLKSSGKRRSTRRASDRHAYIHLWRARTCGMAVFCRPDHADMSLVVRGARSCEHEQQGYRGFGTTPA